MLQWLQRLFSGSEATRETIAAPAHRSGVTPPENDHAPSALTLAPTAETHCSGVSAAQKDDVDARYYNWLFDAAGAPRTDVIALETEVLETLDNILDSGHAGADLVGRLPGLIPQLLHSLRSDTFSGAELARTISNDVVLVAALIRLANSSAQSTGKAITSIEHAVILIGQKGLRQLITSIAFHPIIDKNSGNFTRTLAPRIMAQSERCAAANRMLAEEMGVASFDAFLAGLVQYAGLNASLRIMDKIGKDNSSFGSSMFCSRLMRSTHQLTCSIAREFDFPAAVTLALSEQGDKRSNTMLSPLGQLLALGDYLSKAHILVEHGRLAGDDASLFAGLTAEELDCYRHLNQAGMPPVNAASRGSSH